MLRAVPAASTPKVDHSFVRPSKKDAAVKTYGYARKGFASEFQRLMDRREARQVSKLETKMEVGSGNPETKVGNPLVQLFGSSTAPLAHVPPKHMPGSDLLTIPMTRPVAAPVAGNSTMPPPTAAEALTTLQAALRMAGVDISGWRFEPREFEAQGPNMKYTDRQVFVDFGGGKREHYSADLLMKNPQIALTEIKRLTGLSS